LNPRSAAAFDELARIWRDAGVPNLALPDATRAVYFAPTSAEAHNTLGTVLAMLGQLELARREFGRALALDPGAEYARTNLCRLATDGPQPSSPGGCRLTEVAAIATDMLRQGPPR
jgi:Flp pilus assembly protein TadD